MSFLLRYASVLGLGMISLLMFVNGGTVTGQMLASAGGYGVQDLDELPLYVLAAAGVLGLTSVARFASSGFLRPMRDWCERNLGHIAMLAMIGALGAAFVIA